MELLWQRCNLQKKVIFVVFGHYAFLTSSFEIIQLVLHEICFLVSGLGSNHSLLQRTLCCCVTWATTGGVS